MDNLFVYAKVKTVPKEATKQFTRKGGFSGTDINPMWRIQKLTEVFGPAGLGWYTETVKTWTETYPDFPGVIKVYCSINLYVRDPETSEWSKPIAGTGGNDVILERKTGQPYINDDCYKMAETDALGAACKKLGIGADVYWESDRDKYTIEDDGTVTVYTPTDEEIKAENRAKKAEQVNNFLPNLAMPQKAAEATSSAPAKAPEKEAPKATTKLPPRSEIQKRLCHIRDHEDCQELKDLASKNQWGDRFGRWSEKEIFDAYRTLSAMGVDI